MENSIVPKPPLTNTEHPSAKNPYQLPPNEEPAAGMPPGYPLENGIPQQATVSPDQQSAPPETIPPLENKATVASDTFLKQEKHSFLRSLGHVIRTAAGEFFTWFGGPMIPAGIAFAVSALRNPDTLKNITQGIIQDPIFKERIATSIGPNLAASALGKLQPLVDATPMLGAGIGIAASVVGLLSNRIGTAIGWNSAKHGNENVQKLFQLGKMAELGAATISVINPALSFLYPVAKGFSIAAAFIGHTKRP